MRLLYDVVGQRHDLVADLRVDDGALQRFHGLAHSDGVVSGVSRSHQKLHPVEGSVVGSGMGVPL